MASQNHTNGLPHSVDLSHHVNAKSQARHPSPLKDIIQYMSQDGMISLAGGLPHQSLFPIHDATLTVSNHSATPNDGSCDTVDIQLSNKSEMPTLAEFLQYGDGAGNKHLRDWCLNFALQIHQPAFKDVEVLLHAGNTNAWSKVVGLLCEAGDYILCESFTYPSAQALWIPLGNFAAPIPMDDQGIRADVLDKTLSTWNVTHPGVRRPHVLYLVSVGSNPSGITMGKERKRQIYDICVQYDVIIVEDDPYFFIQYSAYDLAKPASYKIQTNEDFTSSLQPSFLRYDYQGRVIRLESFSKSLAPGLRLGYFVTNSLFSERLLRATEVETQDPAGLSQAVVLALLRQWTVHGYLTWLQNLRNQYHMRRDWMINAFSQHFQLLPAAQFPELEAEGMVAAIRAESKVTPIFSFVSPTGGMFIWCKFYLTENPRFKELKALDQVDDPEQTFADELWKTLVQNLILLTPGSYYHPWEGSHKISTKARGADPGTSHFRFSFAMTTKEDMELGITRLVEVIKSSWQLQNCL